MGIKERQDRERHAVRASILTAARDLFVSEGYPNVSIRKIAERIEYSPAAIYSYFPGKDDIFFALATEGFQRLDDAIKDVVGDPDPLQDLRNCWAAFYTFSKEQREFFLLMFVDRSVPAITEPMSERSAMSSATRKSSGCSASLRSMSRAGSFHGRVSFASCHSATTESVSAG